MVARRSLFRRFARPAHGGLLATLLATLLTLAVARTPAEAQGLGGWLGNLFGGAQRPQDAPGYGQNPDYYTPRRRAPRRKQTNDQTPDATKAKPVKTATVFVDVFGDTFGQQLANGLDDALADKTEVGVVHLARGSTGLVNDAYYDWPQAIEALVAKRKGRSAKDGEVRSKDDKVKEDKAKDDKPARIDVAVMMIGSNDRQTIVKDGKKIEPGTDAWNALYRQRVLAIAEAFEKAKVPLVWVGIPIVKNDDVADDMAALNDIYRDVATRTGATFVDTWEGFSDDKGDFAAYGPDVNGQSVRLRTAEGIYFTKAGGRKLAHFVETQVRRDLDGRTPLPDLPTGEAPDAAKVPKAGTPSVMLVKPEAGPIKKLGEAPAAKDGKLLDAPMARDAELRDATVANALVRGQSSAPPSGRADDFRWPADGKP